MAKYDCQRFSGLEQLPTSMLEKIIEQDLNQEVDYDQELIDYVLEIMVERAKKEDPHRIPDVQSSWNKLRQRLDGEVNLGSLPTPIGSSERAKNAPRRKGFLRYVAVVAACIAMMLGAMVTVQAMGVDVFGTLAKWTDSLFQFDLPVERNSRRSDNTNDLTPNYRKVLSGTEIPIELIPTYIPSGYALDVVDDIDLKNIGGIHASYIDQKGYSLNVDVMKHNFPKTINQFHYFKDPGEPVLYTSNGIPYYIFTTDGLWPAVGTTLTYTILVNGVESEQELKMILDSIRGNLS